MVPLCGRGKTLGELSLSVNLMRGGSQTAKKLTAPKGTNANMNMMVSSFRLLFAAVTQIHHPPMIKRI
jgi:hypothetical protein